MNNKVLSDIKKILATPKIIESEYRKTSLYTLKTIVDTNLSGVRLSSPNERKIIKVENQSGIFNITKQISEVNLYPEVNDTTASLVVKKQYYTTVNDTIDRNKFIKEEYSCFRISSDLDDNDIYVQGIQGIQGYSTVPTTLRDQLINNHFHLIQKELNTMKKLRKELGLCCDTAGGLYLSKANNNESEKTKSSSFKFPNSSITCEFNLQKITDISRTEIKLIVDRDVATRESIGYTGPNMQEINDRYVEEVAKRAPVDIMVGEPFKTLIERHQKTYKK